jgi:hypothetical protein
MIDEDERTIGEKGRPVTDTAIRWRSLFVMPGIGTFTCRAATVREHALTFRVGGGAEDYGFWLDLLEHGRAANAPESLYRYRVHTAQVSQRRRQEQQHESDVLGQVALTRLGVPVTLDDVAALREIYLEPPKERPRTSLRVFRLLLRALDGLGHDPRVDRHELRALRADVLKKLVVASRRDARMLVAAVAIAGTRDPRALLSLVAPRLGAPQESHASA